MAYPNNAFQNGYPPALSQQNGGCDGSDMEWELSTPIPQPVFQQPYQSYPQQPLSSYGQQPSHTYLQPAPQSFSQQPLSSYGQQPSHTYLQPPPQSFPQQAIPTYSQQQPRPPLAPAPEYLSIRVLILDWDKNDVTLKVNSLVEGLLEVFRDLYRFEVHRLSMNSQNPRSGLSLILDTIYNVGVQDPSLLIIYYLGHGGHGGQSEMKRDEMVLGRGGPGARVNFSDTLLDCSGQAHGDVLLIFDCCFAGKVRHLLRDTQVEYFKGARNVQVIAAANEDKYSYFAIDANFTNRITQALKSMSFTPTFTPAQLLDRVNKNGMLSTPCHYTIKGASDIWLGRLNPARDQEKDYEKHGEDQGYLFPEERAVNDNIRSGGWAAHSFMMYQQQQQQQQQ